MSQQSALDQQTPKIGAEVVVDEWAQVDQAQINTFADATGDHQWAH